MKKAIAILAVAATAAAAAAVPTAFARQDAEGGPNYLVVAGMAVVALLIVNAIDDDPAKSG